MLRSTTIGWILISRAKETNCSKARIKGQHFALRKLKLNLHGKIRSTLQVYILLRQLVFVKFSVT